MAFNFSDLTPAARRAAFAHMGPRPGAKRAPRSLGTGAQHRRLSAKSKATVPAPKPDAGTNDRVDPYKGKLSAGYIRGEKPTADDHALLASRYLEMHGTGGVRKKIAQLQARKKLTAKDQQHLSALQSVVGRK